ncbi:hypothetical protein E2562_020061 [Oryza meyeriana var. granulata]|uniref:Uncharacterized protein n=1 Tax=Oryza meyeriana var. granulata TaxID=110450 RepID=A0A6G1BXR9_9ORYZ|nr:hypothetical protein E2562_020061 [Oryza meyeriana var. granulata]
MRSAMAAEEVHLQEGRQQLESLVRVAKAVYDHDVAEVERECSALDRERVVFIAAREKAMKALRELVDQREALTILKAWARGTRAGGGHHTARGHPPHSQGQGAPIL